MFEPIRVLTRPKVAGLVTHWGVEFPEGFVVDYTKDHGLRFTTIREFGEGMPITVVREIPWALSAVVRERLEQVRRNPKQYDVLLWNCETFAEWLVAGVPKSAQVVGVLAVLGLLLAVVAARS